MKSLTVYDPAMCCSTGVCGPSVDQGLVNLAADIAYIKRCGVRVERFNLGHQPEAFVSNPEVLVAMGPAGEKLPIFVVDGEIKLMAAYPSRDELVSWIGLTPETSQQNLELDLTLAQKKRSC